MRYRRDFAAGARAMLPWLLSVMPFGLITGVSVAQAAVSTGAGWLTGPAIYGGSAQIAAIQLLDTGATSTVVILTVLVINLRLVIYSAALARYWRGTPLWWRLLAGYLLVDPSFVVGLERYSGGTDDEADRRRGHTFYLGGAVVLWAGWLAVMTVGALAGANLPAWMRLDLLVPLYLVGLIVVALRERTSRLTVVLSAAVAAACVTAPMHLGVAIGILAGLAVGAAVRRPAPRLSTQEVHS